MAQESLGNGRMYLFNKPGNTKLIISAHGGKENTKFPPPEETTIYFCSMHGKSTKIDVDDIVTSLTSNARLHVIKQVGFHPHLVGDLNEYSLSKFAGKHGGGEWENYKEYNKMIKKGVDILTPRNRWFSKEINLSYVLNNQTIRNKNYKEIYCSFCRS